MPNEFQYGVFLSHSAKDKAVVLAVAERLPENRSGLQPFPDAPTKGSLAQFLYIDWRLAYCKGLASVRET